MTLLRFQIRNGGNFMIFGASGIGKTEMAEQACALEGYEFIYLNLSVLESPDFVGLPFISREEKLPRSEYALPRMLPPKDSLEKKVILLVDEADKAKPELQNPMLELFQFRTINGTPLDVHGVVATGNLPDENAFSEPMSHALMNRCSIYCVTHAYEPWRKWAVNSGVNPLIVSFLGQNPELLLKPPPDGDDTAYCHPSPRSWSKSGKDLDSYTGGDVAFQTTLVSGRVGQTAALSFRVWLEHYRHIAPQIAALVDSGKKPNLESATLDRVFVSAIAAVESITSACRNDISKNDLKRIHAITQNVMSWIITLPSEVQIGALKSTLSMEMITEFELTKVKPFMDSYMKIRKAMLPTGTP